MRKVMLRKVRRKKKGSKEYVLNILKTIFIMFFIGIVPNVVFYAILIQNESEMVPNGLWMVPDHSRTLLGQFCLIIFVIK